MKYINKTLPIAKQKRLSSKEQYLNAWYSFNRIIRFNSSRTLAPLKIYRLLHNDYSLKALTKRLKNKHIKIYTPKNQKHKIMEIFDGDELIYMKNENFSMSNNLPTPFKIEINMKLVLKSATKRKLIPLEFEGDSKKYFWDGKKVITLNNIYPAYMNNHQLFKYFNSLSLLNPKISLLHYKITKNECIKRGLINDKIVSLNEVEIEF